MKQDSLPITVGTILRQIRLKNNRKMIDIANESGVTEAFISNIENNKKVPANEEIIEKLAIAYGIDRRTFFLQFGKLPSDVIREIAEHKDLANFLFEMAKRQDLTKEEKAYHYDKLRLFL